MITKESTYDLVIAGGGLAGVCAALAAARRGLRTALIHDRPVLGGNASSEIRVTVHGANGHHSYARETGIVHELLTEERARNHETINENGWVNSVLDVVLYDRCLSEPNLTLHLNTTVNDVLMADGSSGVALDAQRPAAHTANGYYERPACAPCDRIAALVATTANAEVRHVLRAPLFVDASGDALIAHLAGCAWRMGSEGRDQTGEPHAPPTASTDTMGNSIHIRARDIGRPAPFTPPAWAVQHRDGDYFYQQGRPPHDPKGGFWWIEIGIPWHTIHDNETIRHELTRHALGIWDWMKNHDPVMKERCANYALDWIGQVPGKRDSRRVIGLHLLDEHEVQALADYPDAVAYGGWFVDLHTPGGLLADTSEPAAAANYVDDHYAALSYVGPWRLPLRSLIARDVRNLFLAGRCLSATHAAMGSARVMATTAVMGQAVGTAAAFVRDGDAHTAPTHAEAIRQRLLRDDSWVPGLVNRDEADLARRARVTASSAALSHGIGPEDPWADGGLLRHWSRAAKNRAVPLDRRLGQLIAVAGGRIDALSLCLDAEQATTVRARLWRLEHCFDYRADAGTPVAEAQLAVPAGTASWIDWPVALRDLPDGYYRLDLDAAPGAAWRSAQGMLHAHWAFRQMGPKMRRQGYGWCQAFRITPAQPVFPANAVTNGEPRPYHLPNGWRSDAGQPLPQWIELAWDAPVTIAQVQIEHAAQIIREVHAEPPFYRHPPCAADYRIEGWIDGAWRELTRISGNYQRHRVHAITPVTTARLRLVVTATNGDPSVQIDEVRVYGAADS